MFEDLPVNEVPEPDPIAEVEIEVLDGLPVLADSALEPATRSPSVVPTRQVAAVAATGFVAGAATLAIVHRRRTKVSPKRLTKRKKGSKLGFGEVVGSNSFLVDVHLLRRD